MQIIKSILLSMLFFTMLIAGNILAASNDEVAVAEREQQWRQSWVASDYNTLESLHAEDYYAINNEGHFTTREQVLSDVKAGKFKYSSMAHKDMRIRIYGNSAVVTGITINNGYRGDRDVSGVFAYTRVYIKENNIWRAAMAQYTRQKAI